jgi:Transposase DDE domain
LERGVRQLLADKISGNMVGLWLLIPEHLRLGTWDLLCGWSGQPGERVEPRLGLQLIHESALCSAGLRNQRSLSQRGFELANGLPFVANDVAIHTLLGEHTVADSRRLQIALGQIRRASGDFPGKLLAIDPHRTRSYSKRQMRRFRDDQKTRAYKVAPTFFVLDADTHQPVSFTIATSAQTATRAAIDLLEQAAEILASPPGKTLVLADVEHLSVELFSHVQLHTPFDLLVPMRNERSLQKQLRAIPPEQFTRRWAGFATMKRPYKMASYTAGPFFQFVQRTGERADAHYFGAFLSTTDRDEVDALTLDYPKRWHVEEFFNAHQALGWNRAGTMNLNIRYGQMTMALIAQAALHRTRRLLGEPYSGWDADHFAKSLLAGLEGDIRVHDNTIVVTYYNAPNAEHLRQHYEGLPERLESEHVAPQIPWLYGFKLDFRFR